MMTAATQAYPFGPNAVILNTLSDTTNCGDFLLKLANAVRHQTSPETSRVSGDSLTNQLPIVRRVADLVTFDELPVDSTSPLPKQCSNDPNRKLNSLSDRHRSKRKADESMEPVSGVSGARRNERERNRVRQVNAGFDRLRDHVPQGRRNRKLSKVDTLRAAVEYIAQLQLVLGQADCSTSTSSLYPPFTGNQSTNCGVLTDINSNTISCADSGFVADDDDGISVAFESGEQQTEDCSMSSSMSESMAELLFEMASTAALGQNKTTMRDRSASVTGGDVTSFVGMVNALMSDGSVPLTPAKQVFTAGRKQLVYCGLLSSASSELLNSGDDAVRIKTDDVTSWLRSQY